jgi:predicted alpha/beta-hydrolase family hydrolase
MVDPGAPDARRHRMTIPARHGGVALDAFWEEPPTSVAMLVLAHGAGAGMEHDFMRGIAAALIRNQIAVLRYQFPYMQAGRRRPDQRPVLLRAVRAALGFAASRTALPLFAGGKSMGGRMTSIAESEEVVPAVRGLVFLGFPLHPAGRVSTERAAHLDAVEKPMLFLQGSRDRLADLDTMRTVCRELGGRATLEVVDDADHSFRVPKRSGVSGEAVLAELADRILRWVAART